MKKILFITAAAAFLALPSHAELTVEDTVSPVYLKNSGYSDALINAVQKGEAMNNGEEYTKPVEKEYYNSNKFVKFVRGVFTYLDPALDDNSFMSGHNIKTTPSINDL